MMKAAGCSHISAHALRAPFHWEESRELQLSLRFFADALNKATQDEAGVTAVVLEANATDVLGRLNAYLSVVKERSLLQMDSYLGQR